MYCSSGKKDHTNLLEPNQGKTMGHLEHSDDQKHIGKRQPWNDKKDTSRSRSFVSIASPRIVAVMTKRER